MLHRETRTPAVLHDDLRGEANGSHSNPSPGCSTIWSRLGLAVLVEIDRYEHDSWHVSASDLALLCWAGRRGRDHDQRRGTKFGREVGTFV